MHRTVIVAKLENPETHSHGVTDHDRIRAIIIRKAVISTGMISVVNKYKAQNTTIATFVISFQNTNTNITEIIIKLRAIYLM